MSYEEEDTCVRMELLCKRLLRMCVDPGHLLLCSLTLTNVFSYYLLRLLRMCVDPGTSGGMRAPLWQCQKRPTTVSKETYYSVKRDPGTSGGMRAPLWQSGSAARAAFVAGHT
jgi:hypothetical protein